MELVMIYIIIILPNIATSRPNAGVIKQNPYIKRTIFWVVALCSLVEINKLVVLHTVLP
jgi:hypothetical protein